MKPFTDWMKEQSAPQNHVIEQQLPEGLSMVDGKYIAFCRSCGRTYFYHGEPHDFTQDMSYCFIAVKS
jgi:hypothetical protein